MLLILREEILCLIVLLFLLFYYFTNKIKEKRQHFALLVSVAFAHVVFDILTVISVNRMEVIPDGVNRALHILFYLTGIAFIYGVYNHVIRLCALHRHERLLKMAGTVPLAVFFALLLLFPMEYVQGRGTNYSFGFLAFVGYGIFLAYSVVCLVLLAVSRPRIESRVRWAIFPTIGSMCVMVVLQTLIPELLMTGACVTLACVGMFVALDNPDKKYKEQALWDFLTGLKNRNSFDKDMEMYWERYSVGGNRRRIGFVVADLNDLKTVNDNFGHVEGDRLLSAAADALRESLKQAEHIYRTGGDEFVAIYLSPDDAAVAAEMERVRVRCAAVSDLAIPLSIALGYASDVAGKNIRETLHEADRLMYENKAEMKKEKP